jgi:O-succinylbenzoic acid--CoA ligase
MKTAVQSLADIDADVILMATGRQPNTDGLNLEAAGITLDQRGHIPVDENFQLPLPLERAGGEAPIDFAAMVPLQVWNLLQQAPERLRQIRHLIIGGGAINNELAEALKDMPNAIWSTYGMTETLSHIALRRLNGPERNLWYTPFDGVNVSLNPEGCLVINAPAVHDGPLVTNDIAELSGLNFRILGRKDNVVCSGGIKIQIEEVERLLHPHLLQPFLISKAPDKKLGEQVVLLTTSLDVDAVKVVCQKLLPRYWQPRQYLHIETIPLTATGKPARAEAEILCRSILTIH